LCKSCKEESKKARERQEYLIGQLRARSSKTPKGTSKKQSETMYIRGPRAGKLIHVSQFYDDGYHVSWDAMPDGTVANPHWTNHKTDSHEPPPDALIGV
jgi:hypothetical protein